MQAVTIGGQLIDPPLALAPMVGLSHSALRTVVAEIGDVGLFFTEMLSAKRLPTDCPETSPFLIRSTAESPLYYQIYLSDENDIGPALQKINEVEGNGVDLNLGCPAPKLRKQSAGVYLSYDLKKLYTVLCELRSATHLPLSVKIRLGNEHEKEKFRTYCRFLEDTGVDLITVHARFNKEKFCRKPKWHWLKIAKEAVKVPVFANGGIYSVQDAVDCLQVSGADGLMLGRGAVVRPWLFRDICCHFKGEHMAEIDRKQVFDRFIQVLEERFPERRRLGRIKQFTTLYAESFKYGHLLATGVQRSMSIKDAKDTANRFFQKHIHC